MPKPGKLSASEREVLGAYDAGVMHSDLSPQRRQQLQQSAQQALREKLPHPGEFIREVYLELFNISTRQLATALDVMPSTLSRILRGRRGISPEMALRLSRGLGRSPESWLAMQNQYDLRVVRNTLDVSHIRPFDFEAA